MKKLFLVVALVTASAATAQNDPVNKILNSSPTIKHMMSRSVEQIETEKLVAKRMMADYCNRQVPSLLLLMVGHYDSDYDYSKQADSEKSGSRAELIDSTVDDFVRRCGWMLN